MIYFVIVSLFLFMTVCLNMIVKDERDVIERCLASVTAIIDYWVIVDTGSSDDTKSLIINNLKDVPGELYERPWVHFERNRNEALALARGKAKYLLFIDADEELLVSKAFKKGDLSADFYKFRLIERGKTDVFRVSLIKDHPSWFWKGVIHEAIYSSERMVGEVLETIVKQSCHVDGKRTQDPLKFLKDAAILEKALLEEPENTRYMFYLAQSYGNAGVYDKSIEWYEKRAQILDYEEEVFWSLYCAGMLHQHIGSPFQKFTDAYTRAFQISPHRSEPLFQLASYYYKEQKPLLAYAFSKSALSFLLPESYMYCHGWIYEYAAMLLFAESAEALGFKEEALSRYRLALQKNLPPSVRQTVCASIERLS